MRRIILFILLLAGFQSMATHNRAGEITYEQIGELTIRMRITTYTKSSSTAADRDSLEVFWGDGTRQFVKRSNGYGFPLPNDVKINYYDAQHTYPGRATYTIYFTDPNRVSNILNVNPPNSIDIPFFLSTTFTLLDPQFQGFNNSAVLLQPPLDFGCVGKEFIHNPNAYDTDGDSLSYEMIIPKQGLDDDVPNYIFPQHIGSGMDNQITLDRKTGTFTWRYPKIQGEYNVAFRIDEYRNGTLINSIIRDMQILIRGCENLPPVIESIEEICVAAGDRIEIPIRVFDPETDQKVLVETSGGPFVVSHPAMLDIRREYQDQPLDLNLIWDTECIHISNHEYQVVIRAVDNYLSDSMGLATLKTLRIKIVGPAPENMNGFSTESKLRLEWDKPYLCEEASERYFQGFSVWRKEQSQTIPINTCNPGLEGYGYEKIVYVTNLNDGIHYYLEDADIQSGTIYCYRVLAEFAKLTSNGNPYNRVESLPSNEICLIPKRDAPFITEVSVVSTSETNGIVKISWTPPISDDVDTILNPGPYTFQLEKEQQGNFQDVTGARFVTQYFGSMMDTTYSENGLNTQDLMYNYRIAFFTGTSSSVPYGYSPTASTIFLDVISSDRKSILNWTESTPWNNYRYVVLRKNSSGMYEPIGTSDIGIYEDIGLTNGEEYCYFIRSEGRYGIANIGAPIFNNSQVDCTIPYDIIPPCSPIINVSNLCEELINDPQNPVQGNTIKWTTDQDCEEDIRSFNIYFAQTMDDDFALIEESSSSIIFLYFHEREGSISGCYAVTSLDSLGNESVFSNIVCVYNCHGYILPNTFTPNGDNYNDLFIPRLNRFIDKIEIKIFNQWGNKVFETSDPNISWDGTNLQGDDLSEGVYYYTCKIFDHDLEGSLKLIDVLKGHINLIR